MTVGLTRIVVASSLPLVADTVEAALSSRGFQTCVLQREVDVLGISRFRPEAGVLLSDIASAAQLQEARQFLASGGGVPWLLLSGAPAGPIWGAAIEAGAVGVFPSGSSLEEVDDVLRRLAAGQEVMGEQERQGWVDTWHRARNRHALVLQQMSSLTPRERDVLMLLYRGRRVRDIATDLEVSEATVRSHVKTTLRKLGASSQIDAVALLAWLRDNPQLGLPD